MTYERLPYEDAAPPTEMISDCAAAGRALRLPAGPGEASTARERLRGAEEVVVPDSLADLAREMQLHFR